MKSSSKRSSRLFMLVLMTVLTACGGNGEEANGNENNANAEEGEEEVTLTYARGVDTTGDTEVLAGEFEKQHPNIKIEFQEMPSDSGDQHDQYVSALTAYRAEIDAFDEDVIWPAEFAQADYVLELDRFIEEDDIHMDEYFPGPVEAGNFKGKQWAMPKFIDAGVLFYRTDIVEDPPETWDELIDSATDLQG